MIKFCYPQLFKLSILHSAKQKKELGSPLLVLKTLNSYMRQNNNMHTNRSINTK